MLPRSTFPSIRLLCFSFAITAVVLSGLWLTAKLSPDDTLRGASDVLNVVSLGDGGIGFRVPRAYFHPSVVPSPNSRRSTISLAVLLPEMSPVTDTHRKLRSTNQWSSYARIAISGTQTEQGSRRKTLAEMIPFQIRLHHVDTEMPDLYDLKRIGHGDKVTIGQNEVLYEGDLSDPRTVIICREDIFTTSPRCQMEFHFKNTVTIAVSFKRKEWLHRWSDIRSRTIDLLNEFNAEFENFKDVKGEQNGTTY